ncbi:hypothetical protein SLS53_004553 [Cytospora paraplurivora]|uniref:Uncharacterized protein n=1 Tax=Cytospora paraplurivora TaxID=2898453 RepID=A0AAN9UGG2_9PEZI
MGTWLIDLSSHLPDAQLDGLDITLKTLPPKGWIPPNVNFREWNVREPVPGDLVGKYDIVHVRYLCLVLGDDEVSSVVENVAKLLKPGGYLQWGEVDPQTFRIETTGPDKKTDALQRIYDLEAQDARLVTSWVSQLPSIFENAGLRDVLSDVRDPPGYLAWQMHETMLLIHEMVARNTDVAEIAQSVRELVPEAIKEGKAGAAWVFTRQLVVGRKPVVA